MLYYFKLLKKIEKIINFFILNFDIFARVTVQQTRRQTIEGINFLLGISHLIILNKLKLFELFSTFYHFLPSTSDLFCRTTASQVHRQTSQVYQRVHIRYVEGGKILDSQ